MNLSPLNQSSIDVHRRLFVSDLDGTLLGASGTLSVYSRNTLHRLLEEGMHFTIASARAANEITPILGDLPLKLPIIAVNGAYLTDYQTGQHLIINHLPPQTARSIYEVIRSMDFWPFVCTFDGKADNLYYQTRNHPAMEWYCGMLTQLNDRRLRHTASLADVFEQTVISLAVMGDQEPIGRLADTLTKDFAGQLENFYFQNPYSPQYWWLTIHDKKACKSIALRELMETKGFQREQLTVFGDHINDIGMFKLACRAVAVANAEPQVKAVADEIIGTNLDDSVVKYLLGQWEK